MNKIKEYLRKKYSSYSHLCVDQVAYESLVGLETAMKAVKAVTLNKDRVRYANLPESVFIDAVIYLLKGEDDEK